MGLDNVEEHRGPAESRARSFTGSMRGRWSREAYAEIRQGGLVDTFARSKFADARRKAAEFGAMGSTIPRHETEEGLTDVR